MASADAVNAGSQREVKVFAERDALTRAAAEQIVTCASQAVQARGRFLIALSGGSTPQSLYRLLATEPYSRRIEWARVHVCWGD